MNAPDTTLDPRFSDPGAKPAGWDEALLTRLARAWAGKWDGQWQYQVRDGRFGQTRHRFA